MAWKPASLAVIGLFVLGGSPSAVQAGPAAAPTAVAPTAVAPTVRAFSPAAAHPGGDFLIDADFAGARVPRVWVGAYRVPRNRVRVEAQTSGARRVWGRVPVRVPAGEHLLKIATRAGVAVAAKPIHVASCGDEPEPPTGGCEADIPDAGVLLHLTGSNAYNQLVHLTASPTFDTEPSDASKSYINACSDTGDFRCFTLRMTTQARAEIHVGTAPVIELNYYDGPTGNRWARTGGTVQVLEARPDGVGLCIDAVLTFIGVAPDGVPKTLNVKGYEVFSR